MSIDITITPIETCDLLSVADLHLQAFQDDASTQLIRPTRLRDPHITHSQRCESLALALANELGSSRKSIARKATLEDGLIVGHIFWVEGTEEDKARITPEYTAPISSADKAPKMPIIQKGFRTSEIYDIASTTFQGALKKERTKLGLEGPHWSVENTRIKYAVDPLLSFQGFKPSRYKTKL